MGSLSGFTVKASTVGREAGGGLAFGLLTELVKHAGSDNTNDDDDHGRQ
jgi:hypothetical protein